MKISELADQVRNIPLREVLERYGFEAKPEGTTLRAKSEHHNIVVTGSLWFDNRAGVGGAGAIDLVIHIAKVDFSAACRSLADQFRPLAASQTPLSFPKSSRQLPHQEKKSFEELAAIYAVRDDTKWPIARAYLVEKRKIAADLVDEFTVQEQSSPTIIAQIPAWFSFIAIATASFEEPPCGIPSTNPHSGHAWETNSPHGSQWATSPPRPG